MSTRRALSISGVSQLITFILSFSSVVFVSRVLTPEEIGIFSVSVAVLGIAHILREFGVDQYLIQSKSVTLQDRRAAFTVSIITAWSLALLLFLIRNPLSRFYGHDGVAEILQLLSINFLIMPFGTPLLSMMRRDLQFGRIAVGHVSSAFAHACVTIGAALAGESYLSMAWGAIASHVVKMLVLNAMRPGEILMLPAISGIGRVFRFGTVSSLASMIKELGAASPDLVFGRTLGFTDVALFSRAVGLQKILILHLLGMVKNVHFLTFAKNVREGGDPVAIYGKTVNYLFAVVAPSLGFFSIMAGPMIYFLFGDQWGAAAPLASMIACYSIITVPYMLSSNSIVAVGRVGVLLYTNCFVELVRVLILVSSYWLSLHQVVSLLAVAYFVEAAVSQAALRHVFGITVKDILKSISPALILLPFSLCGPLAVMFLVEVESMSTLDALITTLVSAVLFASGWLMGVFLTRHALLKEIVIFLHAVKKSVL